MINSFVAVAGHIAGIGSSASPAKAFLAVMNEPSAILVLGITMVMLARYLKSRLVV